MNTRDGYWFRTWFPSRGGVADHLHSHVTDRSRPELVSVSTGGGPFWVEVDEDTLSLAQVLDPEAFDEQAQAELAECMVGWPIEQRAMRAAMDRGARRRTALLNAAIAIRHQAGTLRLYATAKQVEYVRNLLTRHDVDPALATEARRALDAGLTKEEAQRLIPRLQSCRAHPGSDVDYDDFNAPYDHPLDGPVSHHDQF